jgi:hypothetical protein
MPLGCRGNPYWRDMSEYAVHFTAPSAESGAHDVLLSILVSRSLEPSHLAQLEALDAWRFAEVGLLSSLDFPDSVS